MVLIGLEHIREVTELGAVAAWFGYFITNMKHLEYFETSGWRCGVCIGVHSTFCNHSCCEHPDHEDTEMALVDFLKREPKVVSPFI